MITDDVLFGTYYDICVNRPEIRGCWIGVVQPTFSFDDQKYIVYEYNEQNWILEDSRRILIYTNLYIDNRFSGVYVGADTTGYRTTIPMKILEGVCLWKMNGLDMSLFDFLKGMFDS